jgi:hypothetical protein
MLRITIVAVMMLCAAAAAAQRLWDEVPISTQTLTGSGKVGQASYGYTINYPRINSRMADFSALNARFAAVAREAASEAVPCNDCGVDRQQEWNYKQDFKVDRPSRRSVLITLQAGGYSGGAHPNSSTTCVLVDLRTGHAAGPSDVFRGGNGWLDAVAPLVRADLKRQFDEGKTGFEEALEPKPLADLLRAASIYCWERERLALRFNAYTVGPYVSGPFEVGIPRTTLQPWINPDGPMGD